jgi:hypothetical protein
MIIVHGCLQQRLTRRVFLSIFTIVAFVRRAIFGSSVQEAIDLAKHAYPELRSVRRDRITFHTTGKSSIACITPAAWQLVVRRLPPYHVVDVRIRDMDGLEGEGDAELPEYSYSTTTAAAVLREKEERYLQKEHPSTEASGNRLRQMMSFVRGG